MNLLNDDGVPIGFGMGLAQDQKAMERFSSMSEKEKRTVIEGAKNQSSKMDMERYISGLSKE